MPEMRAVKAGRLALARDWSQPGAACRRQPPAVRRDAYQAERYRRGERDTRPGYTENPFRTARQRV